MCQKVQKNVSFLSRKDGPIVGGGRNVGDLDFKWKREHLLFKDQTEPH